MNNQNRGPEDIGCQKALSLMSAFIDSMARNDEIVGLEAHLTTCAPCQRQLQAYVSVKNLLRSAEEPVVPVDLVLETRVRLSHERVLGDGAEMRARFKVWAANSIKPFAVPAITGVFSTLLLFGMMLANMEAYGEVPVIAPAQTRIEMTASTYTRVLRPPVDLTQPMYVEVHVGEDGKVPHYFVLLGPENDPAVDTWLDDLLFVAVFAPATLDGQPIHSKLIMFLPGISIGVDES